MPSFETILNAYSKAVGNLDWRTQSHDDFIHGIRQCWAFRARLVAMYRQERDDAELYRTLADPLPDEYWRTENMEHDPLLGMEEQDG